MPVPAGNGSRSRAQHTALDVGPFAPARELELTRGVADLRHARLQLTLHHTLRRALARGEPLRERKTAHSSCADDGDQDDELQAITPA